MTAAKERPILFSGPMVRALLDGRKTQTRRVVKPQPYIDPQGNVCVPDKKLGVSVYGQHPDGRPQWENFARWRCPYGVPGDRLWVKEGWRYINHQTGPRGFEVCVGYEADGDDLPHRPSLLTGPGWEEKVDHWPFRSRRWPSIHMPRWASRLTLEITEVRVERLQDISAGDSIAEGVECPTCTAMNTSACYGRGCFASIAAYRDLWTDINGSGSWAANPWVWAVSFRVLERA